MNYLSKSIKISILITVNIVLLFDLAYSQSKLKTIPLVDDQLDTVGFVKLFKDFHSSSFRTSVHVEFNDGKTIQLDNRLGESKNGDRNIINDIVAARYQNGYINLIWKLGFTGFSIANLFKMVDFENNIVHHICGQYLGFPKLGVEYFIEFIDFETIHVNEVFENGNCRSIFNFSTDGSVVKYIQNDGRNSCFEIHLPPIDTNSYYFAINKNELLAFNKVSSVFNRLRVVKNGRIN